MTFDEKSIPGVACPACTGWCMPVVLTRLTGRGAELMALAHCHFCGMLFMPGSEIEKGILDEYRKAAHSPECSFCGRILSGPGKRKKHEQFECPRNPDRRDCKTQAKQPRAVAGKISTARYGCVGCNHSWVTDYVGEHPECPMCEESETYAIARFDGAGKRVILKDKEQ